MRRCEEMQRDLLLGRAGDIGRCIGSYGEIWGGMGRYREI
jgi:hypothetical protein